MNPTTITLLSIVVAGGLLLGLVLRRLLHEIGELKRHEPSAGLLMMQTQLDALREQVRSSLEGGRLEIDRRLEETNRAVGEVSRGLGDSMPGLDVRTMPVEEQLATRGW